MDAGRRSGGEGCGVIVIARSPSAVCLQQPLRTGSATRQSSHSAGLLRCACNDENDDISWSQEANPYDRPEHPRPAERFKMDAMTYTVQGRLNIAAPKSRLEQPMSAFDPLRTLARFRTSKVKRSKLREGGGVKQFAFIFLMLAACQSEEDRELANMSASERASYVAVDRYLKCVAAIVESAKQRPDLPDQDVERLGYGCPIELHEAATKLAARPDYWADEPGFATLPMDQRVAKIKSELAGTGYCKLRECNLM